MTATRGSNQGNGEFHRADPAYRRQMQVVLGLTVVAGLLGLLGLWWWLGRLGSGARLGDLANYQAWLYRLLAGLCLVIATGSAAFSAWLWRTAAASKAERRWPPSAMRTSADVRIRYLTSADSLVSQLKASALMLALLALALFGWAIWLFWTA